MPEAEARALIADMTPEEKEQLLQLVQTIIMERTEKNQ